MWFFEASTIFGDPLELSITVPDRSISEQRFLSLSLLLRGRTLVVSYVERTQEKIRVISAREASHQDRGDHESGQSRE